MWQPWRQLGRSRMRERVLDALWQGHVLQGTADQGSRISLERLVSPVDPVFYRQVIQRGRDRLHTDYLTATDAAASFVHQLGIERAGQAVQAAVIAMEQTPVALTDTGHW